MTTFLRCVALAAAVLLALYPLGIDASNDVAVACAVTGVVTVPLALYLRRSWLAALAAAIFCVEYAIVLVAGSIALDAFVLVEAILVIVLLETVDLASGFMEHVEVAVTRARFGFLAGALFSGVVIGLVVLSLGPVGGGRDAAVLVVGAIAALCAGAGVLVAMRRVA